MKRLLAVALAYFTLTMIWPAFSQQTQNDSLNPALGGPAAQILPGTTDGTFVGGADARLNDGFVLGCTRGASPKNFYNGTLTTFSHYAMTCPGGASAAKLVFAGYYQDPINQRDTATGVGVYRCNGASVAAGGTGYAFGDIIILANTNAVGQTCTLRVTGINSGAVTQVTVQIPGVYSVPLSTGTAQASTSGAGSGATFNLTWDLGAYMLHLGIEPVYNTQTLAGPNANVPVNSGTFVAANGAVTANPDLFVPVGGILVTDSFPVSVPPGGTIAIRVYSGGTGVPLGHHVGTGLTTTIDGFYSNGPDWGQTGNYTNPTSASASGSPVMAPLAMMVRPVAPVKSCVAIGDSIAADSAGPNVVDVGDTSGNMGWVERMMGNKIAWTNYSVPSMQLQFFMNTTSGRQLLTSVLRILHPDCVVQELSVNDFRAGVSYPNFALQEAQMNALLLGSGVKKIFGFTTTPDQTNGLVLGYIPNVTSAAAIQARNTAIRSGIGCAGQGYTACFDFGSTVESGVGSGLFANIGGVLGSLDGLHPVAALHAAMASAAQSWFYGQMSVH